MRKKPLKKLSKKQFIQMNQKDQIEQNKKINRNC